MNKESQESQFAKRPAAKPIYVILSSNSKNISWDYKMLIFISVTVIVSLAGQVLFFKRLVLKYIIPIISRFLGPLLSIHV